MRSCEVRCPLVGRPDELGSCRRGTLLMASYLGVTSCPPPTWRYGPRKSML